MCKDNCSELALIVCRFVESERDPENDPVVLWLVSTADMLYYIIQCC
jgi:hypothetical protein